MNREYAEQDDRERPPPRGKGRPRTENPIEGHAGACTDRDPRGTP